MRPGIRNMCEKHNHLLAVYQRTVRSFALAVDALQAAFAISERSAYRKVQEYVEEARVLSEEARIRLEKHVHEHGCADGHDSAIST